MKIIQREPLHTNFRDRSGETVGHLTIKRLAGFTEARRPVYECECKCGTIIRRPASNLRPGKLHVCSLACPFGINPAKTVTVDGDGRGITEWAEFLGVTRARGHQLWKAGRLESRVRQKKATA